MWKAPCLWMWGRTRSEEPEALMVVTGNFLLGLAQGLGWGFFSASPGSFKLKFLAVSLTSALWSKIWDSHVDNKKEGHGLRQAKLQLACAWNLSPGNLCGSRICSLSVVQTKLLCWHRPASPSVHMDQLCSVPPSEFLCFHSFWCKLPISGIFASGTRRAVGFLSQKSQL